MIAMSDSEKDVSRARHAAHAILDGRDVDQYGKIMVTLEHTVAAILLAVNGSDPRKAASVLNEALVPGVEARLAFYNSKKG